MRARRDNLLETISALRRRAGRSDAGHLARDALIS
jgi:hypothetical protein